MKEDEGAAGLVDRIYRQRKSRTVLCLYPVSDSLANE